MYRREINQVGSGGLYREPRRITMNAVRIERVSGLAGDDTVLTTRLPTNIDRSRRAGWPAWRLAAPPACPMGAMGITYLYDAKRSGIVTDLGAAYEERIPEATGTTDLMGALASIRAIEG